MKKSELLAVLGKKVKGYSVEKICDNLTTITVEMENIEWKHIYHTAEYILHIDPKDKYTISVIYNASGGADSIELD